MARAPRVAAKNLRDRLEAASAWPLRWPIAPNGRGIGRGSLFARAGKGA
jgi:hypothetical protein